LKFFLVDEHGQVGDPAGLITAVPNWTVGKEINAQSNE
jgi:hypothetical protein